MQRIVLAASLAAAFLFAFTGTPANAMSCVAYARDVSGLALNGDAWQWWGAARGTYARGHIPEPGAIIVFARSQAMPLGHLAIVRAVQGPREILIDQANWQTSRHKGRIETAVSAIDVSRDNDWSLVRVEWAKTATYGRVNPVRGFIYAPKRLPPPRRRRRLAGGTIRTSG